MKRQRIERLKADQKGRSTSFPAFLGEHAY